MYRYLTNAATPKPQNPEVHQIDVVSGVLVAVFFAYVVAETFWGFAS